MEGHSAKRRRQAQSASSIFKLWLFLLCPVRLGLVLLYLAIPGYHAIGILKIMCAGVLLVVSLVGVGFWVSIEKTAPGKIAVRMIITDILAIVVILPILFYRFGSPPLFHIPGL
jgi:hypothetical protein